MEIVIRFRSTNTWCDVSRLINNKLSYVNKREIREDLTHPKSKLMTVLISV